MFAYWPLLVSPLWLAGFALRRRPNRGTRPRGGYRKPSASMSTKAHGTASAMPSIATDDRSPTTVGCSFSFPPGTPLVEALASLPYQSPGTLIEAWHVDGALSVQIRPPHANSFTAHGWSTDVTVTPGVSGERLQHVDFDER